MTDETPVLDTLVDITAVSLERSSLAPRELMLIKSTVDQLEGQGRTELVRPGRRRHNRPAAAHPLRVAL
jgi:hypothetical protein